MALHISPQDIAETSKIAEIMKKVDQIDATFVAAMGDELAKYQPFLISMLLGDAEVLSPEELEEGMKCYFMIWEYFKDSKFSRSKPITASQFQRILDCNLDMVAYMGGEPTHEAQEAVIAADLQQLNSKALFVGLQMRFDIRPALSAMGLREKSAYLLGMKSLVACFEELGE